MIEKRGYWLAPNTSFRRFPEPVFLNRPPIGFPHLVVEDLDPSQPNSWRACYITERRESSKTFPSLIENRLRYQLWGYSRQEAKKIRDDLFLFLRGWVNSLEEARGPGGLDRWRVVFGIIGSQLRATSVFPMMTRYYSDIDLCFLEPPASVIIDSLVNKGKTDPYCLAIDYESLPLPYPSFVFCDRQWFLASFQSSQPHLVGLVRYFLLDFSQEEELLTDCLVKVYPSSKTNLFKEEIIAAREEDASFQSGRIVLPPLKRYDFWRRLGPPLLEIGFPPSRFFSQADSRVQYWLTVGNEDCCSRFPHSDHSVHWRLGLYPYFLFNSQSVTLWFVDQNLFRVLIPNFEQQSWFQAKFVGMLARLPLLSQVRFSPRLYSWVGEFIDRGLTNDPIAVGPERDWRAFKRKLAGELWRRFLKGESREDRIACVSQVLNGVEATREEEEAFLHYLRMELFQASP